jgi:type IV pilus assembly protein PilW
MKSAVYFLQPLKPRTGNLAVMPGPSAHNYRSSYQQKGLTLVEIMVALLLGLFVLGGIMQIFSNSKQTYKMQEALSRLQENGRFAMDFLGRDIRMADFRSCSTALPLLDPANGNKWGVTGSNGVEDATNHASDAPDSITLRWTDTSPCLAPSVTTTYTVATGLQQSINGAAAVQMIEGMENMQITYGVDSDGDTVPNYYAPAGTGAGTVTPALMGSVYSVRVSILLATIDDNLTAAAQSINYNGGTLPPTDRRIRRVFNSTFTLRNRPKI